MKPNNTFNITRFGLLFRQNLIHHYKLNSLSLVAFCGGLFMLLLIIQFFDGFQPQTLQTFQVLLLILFFGTGIICAGTAFPGFRTKEKSLNYLMNPASALEKFLMEFLSRVLLFILVIPFIYWAVYNVEGYLVKMIYPTFSFESQMPFSLPSMHLESESFMRWVYTLVISGTLLVFVIPFTGATIFVKNPLIKTLFGVALIFFFNFFIFYLFIEVFLFKEFHPSGPILFISEGEDAVVAGAIAGIAMNLAFISAAYFKLKEKEV